jgi:NDP-sugar pyrophosphorylase family protein/aminoglycoside/choline kinase family phosphotransferase
MKLSVFILAAGLGERLRPITDHIPKPLLPVLGKPVLQTILEKITTLPVNKIGINLHHKKKLIEDWINQSPFKKLIELFPEDPILGTGGALKNAESFLSSSIFLVHNSDIISDIDLEKLIDSHLSSKNLITLAVHDYPEFNNLIIDENGYLIDIQHKILKQVQNDTCVNGLLSCRTCFGISGEPLRTKKLKAFTGIAVYSSEFLKFLPSGTSSVVNTWMRAIKSGYRIGTFDVSGCYWKDLGTPFSYAKTVIDELKKNGEIVYIHPSVDWCKYVELDGYVVVENENVLNKAISLRNCIVLPGSTAETRKGHLTPPIPPLPRGGIKGVKLLPRGIVGEVFENCILGPGFKIDLSESEILGSSAEADALLIGTGGSDRKYYRIKRDNRSAVLMECAAGDPDFQRHIEYTRFFVKHSIPVPELISIESDKIIAYFEDLGDLSLYSWLKCPRGAEEIEEIYKKVIDILILIHISATEYVSECPLLKKRVFDYEYLRWETGYFIERFVEGIKNIKINNQSVLNDEFHRLALKVDSFPKTIIHRDFQSQNIMIIKRCIPRLLDYQGARIGPSAYDLVSILWDPYYRLEDTIRKRLLDYYISKIHQSPLTPSVASRTDLLKREAGGDLKMEQERILEKEFRKTLLPCRLQRHMQALGAYGFLSKIKGKQYFLKFVPEGLRLLREDISLSKEEYPELYILVTAIP